MRSNRSPILELESSSASAELEALHGMATRASAKRKRGSAPVSPPSDGRAARRAQQEPPTLVEVEPQAGRGPRRASAVWYTFSISPVGAHCSGSDGPQRRYTMP